jgi:hypothetical protein
MSRETLENWIAVVKECKSSYELQIKSGVYDGMHMWMDLNTCESGKLFELINDNKHFEFWGKSFLPDHYNKEFVKVQRYGLGKNTQFYFSTPTEKIIFPEDSDISSVDKESGFEYTTELQLYHFGGFQKVIRGLKFLVEDFILPNEVPTYVLASNCSDEKYKRFSSFIND